MKECEKIFGEAEVDESYFGARRKRGWRGKLKRDRGTHKQPVFGILKRNGRVYTEIVPNCKKRCSVRPHETLNYKTSRAYFEELQGRNLGITEVRWETIPCRNTQ